MVITIAMVGHGRGMRWLRLHYDTKSPLLHILVTTTMYIVYHPSPPSHHHCFYCLDCIEVVHYKHVFHQPRTFSDILTHDRTMFSTDRRRQNTRLLKYLGLFSSNVAYFAWILAVNIFCRYTQNQTAIYCNIHSTDWDPDNFGTYYNVTILLAKTGHLKEYSHPIFLLQFSMFYLKF